jgi:hypothetical protein
VALTYVTGHDLSLTIKLPSSGTAVTFVDVCTSATLSFENEQTVLETLNGRAYKTTAKNATLDVELYQDWGSSSPSSVCLALWTAAQSYPDTKHTAVLTANGKTFTMDIYPSAPPVGGAASDVLTTTVSFVVHQGTITVA